MLKRELNIIFSAILYFTRIPLPFKLNYKKENQQFVLTWFPFIGIIVGSIGALAYWLSAMILPHSVSILLAIGVMILTTGALHEDGWADVCDGFGGGYGKEHILRIMKDSCVGAYAVIGLIMLFALKIITLFAISSTKIPIILIATQALSRCPILLLTKFQKNARQTGESKSRDSSNPLSWGRIMIAFALAFLPLLFLPRISFLLVPILIVVSLLSGCYFKKHIGGYSGDCLGATQQLNEITILLFFCALNHSGILI